MTLRRRLTGPAATTAAGLVLGHLADGLLGDPRRGHPVAGFGSLALWLERRTYADDRLAGAGHVALLVGGVVALGFAGQRVGRRPAVRLGLVAAAAWTVLGGRSLRREGETIAGLLRDGDLGGARRRLRHLVGRDTAALGPAEVARAAVESLAENTSDAVVAPLLWGAVGGLPGLLGYRAVNTLDAMIGHHSPRYERFGWAAARLDDVANWVPARVAAAAAALAAPVVSGSPRRAVTTVRRDAGRHPSPNAGVVEAAFAGALGVRLGGTNVYAGRVEDRGHLGDGREVEVEDLARTVRLARATAALGLAVAVGLALLLGRGAP